MSASLYAVLSRALILGVPLGVVALFLLASLLPFGALGNFALAPSFAFAATLFWTLRRPDLFPPGSVFLAGMGADLVGNGALGLWTLAFLSGYAFILWQRILFISRVALPSGVAIALGTGVMLLVAWGVTSWQAGFVLDARPVIVHGVLTVLSFPLVALFCTWVERYLPEPDWVS